MERTARQPDWVGEDLDSDESLDQTQAKVGELAVQDILDENTEDEYPLSPKLKVILASEEVTQQIEAMELEGVATEEEIDKIAEQHELEPNEVSLLTKYIEEEKGIDIAST